MTPQPPPKPWDVLVVGAGPTGLAVAAELAAQGVSVLVVDAGADRVHESRALAIQPRTLEVLRGLGLADDLVAQGNPNVALEVHAGGRRLRTRVFDVGLDDTAFPFLLFLSQAETERILGEHLREVGVALRRPVTLVGLDVAGSDDDGRPLCAATLEDADGARSVERARYVVGCDGARSAVRRLAAIPFPGAGYPQSFVLADLEIDGLERGRAHAFLGAEGPFLVFPLEHPASWRIIAMRSPDGPAPQRSPGAERPESAGSVPLRELRELQELADRATKGAGSPRLRLHDVVWSTTFRLQHREAARYRRGPVLLAGDAAHVHSPVGAQGMNTGIQDAANLGWKLGLVARGRGSAGLLDTYDAERRPVGAFVLRFTDRGFRAATSSGAVVRRVRAHLLPRLLPMAGRWRLGRRFAVRTIAQLRVRYPPSLVVARPGRFARLHRPRAGERLPDARLTGRGRADRLHDVIGPRRFHVLLITRGDDAAGRGALERLAAEYPGLVDAHVLASGAAARRGSTPWLGPSRGAAAPEGEVVRRLHVHRSAIFVVRPDGYIGFRGAGNDVAGAAAYLSRILIRVNAPAAAAPSGPRP